MGTKSSYKDFEVAFGYLNLDLDLDFKLMDLILTFKGLDVILNPRISRFKILGGFGQIQILDIFKLSKLSIWILITQIQIYMSKSCYPNAPQKYFNFQLQQTNLQPPKLIAFHSLDTYHIRHNRTTTQIPPLPLLPYCPAQLI